MKEVFLCSNIRLYGDKMYNSSLELIGNGPLILLNSIMKSIILKEIYMLSMKVLT